LYDYTLDEKVQTILIMQPIFSSFDASYI